MIVFLVPLKSLKASTSWKDVCRLLERTLCSICSQTDPNFRIIVVHHEKPDIQFNHPNIQFVEVNFPLPVSFSEKMLDRTKKLIVGIFNAHQFSPSHVMFVDADDCVSCHIADFVNQNPHANGWFLDKGYVYVDGGRLIYRKHKSFFAWCGTCSILNYDICLKPKNENDFSEELINFYDGNEHMNIPLYFSNRKTPLKPFPFFAAVYNISNGENIYQAGFSMIRKYDKKTILFYLKESLKYRLLTSSIKREFSLY